MISEVLNDNLFVILIPKVIVPSRGGEKRFEAKSYDYIVCGRNDYLQYLFFVASAGFSARDLDSLPPFVHARKELNFIFVKGQHSGS